ncbi:MurR/RpiR family transcriptional regulator [Lactococcus nasutitermitis]|uniref:MurR/RpiR family transcriptional regulator n=1 Tax=Lactococcus nasutitermitis TaxID=1652957 RepID=A0ABV9JC52_9LACT|nr:MurR/RpiR family transcriptional regulator [Lactococcus nasutitermitis]
MVKRSLSEAESYTWRIIQEHYEEIPKTSISELAEIAHVSISTINRTVQKKGFKGYAEFRFSIKEKSIPKIKGFSKEVLAAISKNEEELIKTINSISVESVEAAVEAIEQASEILIFARGLSTNVAIEMMKKLQLYHKLGVIHDDAGSMAYYAKHVTSNSLIIVTSLSGERDEINIPLNDAKTQGATILALTVSENSTLTRLADISLVGYKSPYEVHYFDLDVHSRLPLHILVRVLFDAYSIYKKSN